MIGCTELTPRIKDATFKIFNKQHKQWFYYVPYNTEFCSGFLLNNESEDNIIYLSQTLTSSPWIWDLNSKVMLKGKVKE